MILESHAPPLEISPLYDVGVLLSARIVGSHDIFSSPFGQDSGDRLRAVAQTCAYFSATVIQPWFNDCLQVPDAAAHEDRVTVSVKTHPDLSPFSIYFVMQHQPLPLEGEAPPPSATSGRPSPSVLSRNFRPVPKFGPRHRARPETADASAPSNPRHPGSSSATHSDNTHLESTQRPLPGEGNASRAMLPQMIDAVREYMSQWNAAGSQLVRTLTRRSCQIMLIYSVE